jgi:THUMP domain-like
VLDPDRRARGARSLDPGRWSPTLEQSLALGARFGGAALKLPPAFDLGRLPGDRRPARASWQWVSLRGELAEVVLWTGVLASGDADPDEREALALDGRGGRAVLCGRPEPGPPPLALERLDGVRWLAEPDPAVIRSGLLGLLARASGLAPVAPRIAYLGGVERPVSPLLRAWRVLGVESLDPRRLRGLLERHDVGPLCVKKRGHPEDAERLARRLAGRGRRRGLVAIARVEGGHRAFLLSEEDEGAARSPTRVGDEGFEPPASSL